MNERVRWYRDPVWQTVGTFVALVGLGVTVWFFWLGREQKGLTVTVLANTPLVSVASEVGGMRDLTVLYKGEPTDNIALVQVKVENTGNRAIRAADFSTPLRFTFGEGVQILDAAVVETVPENLGMIVEVMSNEGIVAPLLLNEGDRAVLRFMVDGGSDIEQRVRAEARIVDVAAVTVLETLDTRDFTGIELLNFVVSLAAILVAVFLPRGDSLLKRRRLKNRTRT